MGQRKTGVVTDDQGRRVAEDLRPTFGDMLTGPVAEIRPPGYDPIAAERERQRTNMRMFGVPENEIEARIDTNMMNLRRRIAP